MSSATLQKVRIAALASMVAITGTAMAETMKGRVDAVDNGAKTIQLNGITFQTTGDTQFAGISGLQDLRQGARVTIEFSRDGARYVVKAVSQD